LLLRCFTAYHREGRRNWASSYEKGRLLNGVDHSVREGPALRRDHGYGLYVRDFSGAFGTTYPLKRAFAVGFGIARNGTRALATGYWSERTTGRRRDEPYAGRQGVRDGAVKHSRTANSARNKCGHSKAKCPDSEGERLSNVNGVGAGRLLQAKKPVMSPITGSSIWWVAHRLGGDWAWEAESTGLLCSCDWAEGTTTSSPPTKATATKTLSVKEELKSLSATIPIVSLLVFPLEGCSSAS
jgi:hypothetical protein